MEVSGPSTAEAAASTKDAGERLDVAAGKKVAVASRMVSAADIEVFAASTKVSAGKRVSAE